MKRTLAVLLSLCALAALIFWSLNLPGDPLTQTITAKAAAVASGRTIQPTAESSATVASPVEQVAPSTAEDFGEAELAPVAKPDFAKVVAFNQWAERWAKAPTEAREQMREEGVNLARERRSEFKSLIVTDPRRALEQSVPRVIRQDLPPQITALLEKPVSTMGDFKVYRGRPAPELAGAKPELVLRYFETPKGESYKARVFGALEAATSKKNVPLRGVSIDRELAVAESPVRQLEAGERIPLGAVVDQTCEVSGETTAAIAPEELSLTRDRTRASFVRHAFRRDRCRGGA